MGALGECFGHSGPAQAVLAQRGGSGAGARQLAAGGGAFAGEGGHEHAGAEQGNPLAPQPHPGRDRAVFDGDCVAVDGQDPRGDVAGASLFGLTGATGLGGMIHSGAVIAARDRVVAVGAQRDPASARMSDSARVGDLLGRQPLRCTPLCALVLPRRGAVLVGVWCCGETDPAPADAHGLSWLPAPPLSVVHRCS